MTRRTLSKHEQVAAEIVLDVLQSWYGAALEDLEDAERVQRFVFHPLVDGMARALRLASTGHVVALVKCRYADEYKAEHPPRCGCDVCEHKWAARLKKDRAPTPPTPTRRSTVSVGQGSRRIWSS